MDDDRQTNSAGLRLPSLPDRLEMLERIMAEAIKDRTIKRYRDRAQFTFFCGFDPRLIGGHEGQLEVVGRCLEWFVYDYVIPELNLTPAQHWFDTHEEALSPDDHLIAYNCLQFILGIFVVDEVEAEAGFWVNDLLRNGPPCYVREQLLSQEIHTGQLLLARLFPYQDAYVLSGMATVMSVAATNEIKKFIREGTLVPDEILPYLDGIEIENLFGRSLTDVDRMEDLAVLHRQMRYYLEQTCRNKISFKTYLDMIQQAADPFSVAAHLCDHLPLYCRHEMDLALAYVMATWFQTHKP